MGEIPEEGRSAGGKMPWLSLRCACWGRHRGLRFWWRGKEWHLSPDSGMSKYLLFIKPKVLLQVLKYTEQMLKIADCASLLGY